MKDEKEVELAGAAILATELSPEDSQPPAWFSMAMEASISRIQHTISARLTKVDDLIGMAFTT